MFKYTFYSIFIVGDSWFPPLFFLTPLGIFFVLAVNCLTTVYLWNMWYKNKLTLAISFLKADNNTQNIKQKSSTLKIENQNQSH